MDRFEKAKQQFEVLKQDLSNSNSVKDEAIFEIMEGLSHIQTNCVSAANFLWEKIAYICYFKPALTEKLLHYPIRPMVYVSVEKCEQIFVWVKNLLNDISNKITQNTWYGDPPPQESILWLENQFPKIKRELIEKILQEELEKAKAEE